MSPVSPSDSCVPRRGGVGLGGGWLVARTGGGFPRPVCPSLTSTTGPYHGCLVSEPPRLLTIPEPDQGAEGREIPPCLCVCRAHSGHVGGSGHWVRAQLHTFCLHWAAVLLSACGGGCVCPVLRAPAAGQGSPTLRLLGECVGRETCGLLQPTTEPQRGTRGMWPMALLDSPRGSQVALHTMHGRSWGVLSTSCPRSTRGSGAPGEPTVPWSPQTRRDPESHTARRPLLRGRGGGRVRQVAFWPLGVAHNCTGVHGDVLA